MHDYVTYDCICPACGQPGNFYAKTKILLSRSMKTYYQGDELPVGNNGVLVLSSCCECTQKFYAKLEIRNRKLGSVLEVICKEELAKEFNGLDDESICRALSTISNSSIQPY